MKPIGKRFWHTCGNAVNESFLWFFVALAVLLTIDLWGLMTTATVYLIGGGVKSLTLLKILGALGIVLTLSSNVALWLVMYSPKYNRLLSLDIKNKEIK